MVQDVNSLILERGNYFLHANSSSDSIWIQWRSDFFQFRVLRIIFFILIDLSISEITDDIDFTFTCKGFYHKSIWMNSQCKVKITNNYLTWCDIFHITVLWKELAVVSVTDGLISHNLEFGSSAESCCIAQSFFTPAGSASSPAAEAQCLSLEV